MKLINAMSSPAHHGINATSSLKSSAVLFLRRLDIESCVLWFDTTLSNQTTHPCNRIAYKKCADVRFHTTSKHIRLPFRLSNDACCNYHDWAFAGSWQSFGWSWKMKAISLLAWGMAFASGCQAASAETVQVKYHGRVPLEAFACSDVRHDSDVSRICYDKAERYMLIRLRTTYYHYCDIDAGTVDGLHKATSKRQYFESRIRGNGSDGPFDCRTHPVPRKYRM